MQLRANRAPALRGAANKVPPHRAMPGCRTSSACSILILKPASLVVERPVASIEGSAAIVHVLKYLHQRAAIDKTKRHTRLLPDSGPIIMATHCDLREACRNGRAPGCCFARDSIHVLESISAIEKIPCSYGPWLESFGFCSVWSH